MKKILLIPALIIFCASFVFARDGQKPATTAASRYNSNTGKIGLGFNSQLSLAGVDTLSLRYWTDAIGFEGMVGFSLGDTNKYFDLGGKILFLLKKEQNMNVYGFGLLGIENANRHPITNEDKSDTSVTVAGGLGAEFFLPGLPNLGLSTELGIGYNSTSEIFRTFGDWIPNAGIHYYFQ